MATAEAQAQVDDLTLVLDALSLDKQASVPLASLGGAAAAATDGAAGDATYSAAAAARLAAIVHGEPVHKDEAVRRGALESLVAAGSRHPGDAALHTAISKAVRSLAFKNDAARNRLSAVVVPALAGVLGAAVARLEAVAGVEAPPAEAGAAGEASEAAAARPAYGEAVSAGVALACAEEVVTALTAAVNRHDINTGVALMQGVPALCARLEAALQKGAATLGSGGAGTPKPAAVQQKASFLGMMLA